MLIRLRPKTPPAMPTLSGISNTYFSHTVEDLLRAISLGDEKAFEQFERLCRGRIYSWAYNVLANCDSESAADVTQDVLLKIYNREAVFKGSTVWYTWLKTITRNRAFDYVR